jgi:colanic acid biosynthesis protein WcaH
VSTESIVKRSNVSRAESPKNTNQSEPKPAQRLSAADFRRVVRLTPLVSIDIIVRSPDGRVLVGRRRHEPAKDSLFLPGGRITKNETRAEAFRRLTRQELGVEKSIAEARFIRVSDNIYPTNIFEAEGFGTHYVVLSYELRLFLPIAALPQEQHHDYFWLTEAELLASPAVHGYTKDYFRPLKPV